MPLSGPSLNLAGKPSRLGGAVAGVAGALVLLAGLAVALMVGALFAWLTSVAVALAVGGPIAAVALAVGVLLSPEDGGSSAPASPRNKPRSIGRFSGWPARGS